MLTPPPQKKKTTHTPFPEFLLVQNASGYTLCLRIAENPVGDKFRLSDMDMSKADVAVGGRGNE